MLVAGCGDRVPDPVQVEPPTPEAAARQVCAQLVPALPDRVDDGERRATGPENPLTAAWGDPALVLRCGVERPAGLSPTSEILEVEGVEWFLVESDAGFTFTTVGRTASVELLVPTSVDRTAATAPLVDLAAAIARHDAPSR